MGAIAYKRSEGGDLYAFATSYERVEISRDASVTDIANVISSKKLGGGTDLSKALKLVEQDAAETGTKYDNLIVLTDCDCYGYCNVQHGRYTHADQQVDALLKKGIFRKIWVNNLMGNNFAIVNTAQHTKNLVTGFSEKFLEVLNTYNALGGGVDIKKVIDELLDKKRK